MATRAELEWRADCLTSRMDALARKDADDPCWKGYEQRGTKEQGGKSVPNCVEADAGPLIARVGTPQFVKGDVVRHVDYGKVTVEKVDKRTGAVTVRAHDDGVVGTVLPQMLRRY